MHTHIYIYKNYIYTYDKCRRCRLPRFHRVWNINDHVNLPRMEHGENVGFPFDQGLVDQTAGDTLLGQIPGGQPGISLL